MFSSIMRGMKILPTRGCHTRGRKKPKYGTRFLLDKSKIFDFNAWDDVEWDEEHETQARKKVEENSEVKLERDVIEKFENEADKYWDAFYDIHTNRFFKDRHWLFTEFPELSVGETEAKRIFEVGCGVGNTICPILQNSKSPNLYVYGGDFSPKAIDILKEAPEFDPNRCSVFVLDATQETWEVPLEENSIDIIVLIFVLSAINPLKFNNVIQSMYKYLKPGGLVLFRDYGRYDMAQLRFKPGRSLGENFYVRGDGTRVYFFTQDEVKQLFERHGFNEEENRADRRLQVNRGRLLKMYRVWIQAKYRKT
ncbi:hypothetical protein Zmor_023116 [Zophobas morio]|uniref:tRNA N(3)-methylcytidine methyltransferase n=1 Tax=Zophobas morio TaxID=2755281 RepID=A0AA38I2M3_9CUCU|nr:hypothetical protein Zmor_023116 [Zophobas morio]